MKQSIFASLAFEQKMKPTRRGLVLAEMEAAVAWLAVAYPRHPKAGRRSRQPIPLETMPRIYFMQQWHALSVHAMEHALYEIVSGLVLTVSVTSANVADVTEFPFLLREDGSAVFDDKGYVNNLFKQGGRKAGVFWGVALKVVRQYPMTAANKRFNHRMSSIRARAEHLFRVISASSATRRCATRG